MIARHLLNASLTILKNTPASSGWGNGDGWTPSPEVLPCRIQPISYSQMTDGKTRGDAEYTVYLNYGADIAEADRVKVDGVTYEVVDVRDAAGHHHHIELGVRRI